MLENAPLTRGEGDAQHVALAWSGAHIGAVWEDTRDGTDQIYFTRLHPDGRRVAPADADVRVSPGDGPARHPEIAWTGEDFAVAWRDGADGATTLHAARIDGAGAPTRPARRLTHTGQVGSLELAWAGEQAALVWGDRTGGDAAVMFLRDDLTCP